MAPDVSHQKRRYQELIFQHINDNPEHFVDVESRSTPAARGQAKTLPAGGGRFGPRRQPTEAEGRRLYAVVTPVSDGDAFDAQVIDEAGNVYVDMRGYRTVKLPSGMTLK